MTILLLPHSCLYNNDNRVATFGGTIAQAGATAGATSPKRHSHLLCSLPHSFHSTHFFFSQHQPSAGRTLLHADCRGRTHAFLSFLLSWPLSTPTHAACLSILSALPLTSDHTRRSLTYTRRSSVWPSFLPLSFPGASCFPSVAPLTRSPSSCLTYVSPTLPSRRSRSLLLAAGRRLPTRIPPIV